MVCHETYKDSDNNWVSPNEITLIDGKKFLKKDISKEIIIGPSESMSKSKKNTVDPQNIINHYGADSARLFILSDSPPEKDVQWSEEGINSSFKFIQKLWNLHSKIKVEINKNYPADKSDKIDKFINKFIKKITYNLDYFNYNIVIASLHEMYAFLIKEVDQGYKKETLFENYKKILITMMPIIPHFASECLKMFNLKEISWPTYDEKLLKENIVPIVIQINGKKRSLINAEQDITEENLLILINQDQKLNKYFNEKEIKKKIFIKNKLMNLII